MSEAHDTNLSDGHLNLPELVELLAHRAQTGEESPTYSTLSTEDIESASESLLHSLSAVRRALNARRPVNAVLPPELLLKIFAFVPELPRHAQVKTAAERFCGPYQVRNVWELRSTSQVCHRWREIALSSSRLWASALRKPVEPNSTFMFGGPSRIEEPIQPSYLPRCIAGPIHLCVEENGFHGPWMPLRMLDAPPGYETRVDELHVATYEGWTDVSGVPPSLLTPMPALEHLEVYCAEALSERRVWMGQRPLFGGIALGALRSLALFNVPLLPSNGISHALTHILIAYHLRDTLLNTWRPADLVAFLSGAPALQEAVVDGVPIPIENSESIGGIPAPHVALPRLRKLSIRGWDYFINRAGLPYPLLSRFVLPETCYLRVDASSGGGQLQFLSSYLCDPRFQCRPFQPSSVHLDLSALGGGIRIDLDTGMHWSREGKVGLVVEELENVLSAPPFAMATTHCVPGAVSAV
ncbi:hypothetical protein C8Q76DRAFT_253500 [Earliella scabrosa]|nr:hypothetical protein C8Q76DRAFT_253500 [Earliella scabrosa]